jgi:hypothetical protein
VTVLASSFYLECCDLISTFLIISLDTSGNETFDASAVIDFLVRHNYDIYVDHWNEQGLYFGRHGNVLMEIDRMFGSAKFNLPANVSLLDECARKILMHPINPSSFNQREFLKSATDIIAIEKSLSERMKSHWLR